MKSSRKLLAISLCSMALAALNAEDQVHAEEKNSSNSTITQIEQPEVVTQLPQQQNKSEEQFSEKKTESSAVATVSETSNQSSQTVEEHSLTTKTSEENETVEKTTDSLQKNEVSPVTETHEGETQASSKKNIMTYAVQENPKSNESHSSKAIDTESSKYNKVNYEVQFLPETKLSIDSKPWGEEGFETLDYTTNHAYEAAQVIAENQDKTYYLVHQGEMLLGWVDHRAFSNANYNVQFLPETNLSIDSKPWGTGDYKATGYTKDHAYQNAQVVAENSNGAYYLLRQNNKILGWVDHRAFSNANYEVQFLPGTNLTIDSKPWGTDDYKAVGRTSNRAYQNAQVIAENKEKTYYLVRQNKTILGWIDHRAFSNANYEVQFLPGTNLTIDSKPWGTDDYKAVGRTSNHAYQNAQVVAENKDKAYYLIRQNNKILGWVDYHAFSNANYGVKFLSDADFSIDTKPWGTNGYQTKEWTAAHKNESAQVIAESGDKSYYLVRQGSKLLGWIDNKAFKQNVLAFNRTNNAFLNKIIVPAVELAHANGLYASVMIAQAALESGWGASLLSSRYNNLFGIKGNYKGNSTTMSTLEDNGSGNYYSIRDGFRVYPSYRESLQDYVDLIKKGPSFNSNFYSGAWKTNTNSYTDATAFLTGRYATDTRYAAKLNSIIRANNLTQYDTAKYATGELTALLK